MLIDAHAHIYEYLRPYGPFGEGRAIGKGRLRWPDGTEEQFFPPEYGDTGFTAESLLKVMDENGIDKALLLQAQNYGYQNDYIFETVSKYPDRFSGCCIFDPYGRRAMELFRYFVEEKGVKVAKFEISETWGLSGIHPDLSLDSHIFLPVWEYAEKNGIIIVIDTGMRNSRAWQIYPLLRVKERFPELRFVLAHALFPCDDGFNDTRLAMLKEIADGNTWFDISSVFGDEEYPFCGTQQFLRRLCDIAGSERMMWGSDTPGILRAGKDAYRKKLNFLRNGGLFTPEELENIHCRTAAELYNL